MSAKLLSFTAVVVLVFFTFFMCLFVLGLCLIELYKDRHYFDIQKFIFIYSVKWLRTSQKDLDSTQKKRTHPIRMRPHLYNIELLQPEQEVTPFAGPWP